jgi:hypothetical protein
MMVLLPDPTQLEALSTNPNNGGAYVMWKGTPYAHIMMPVGERPKVSPGMTTGAAPNQPATPNK